MSRPTKAVIDSLAISHNFARVRELAPDKKIIAMIKANAYGHDIAKFAHSLSEADMLGVAAIEEAKVIRQTGVMQPIMLMEGFFDIDELPDIVEKDFVVVIHQFKQIEALENISLPAPVKTWLKINTGMHRLGVSVVRAKEAKERLEKCANVDLIGVMSHCACAEQTGAPETQQQIHLFDQITQAWQLPRSMANSAGICAWPEAHYEWVRPGLMLYGVSPFEDRSAKDLGLKPVMNFESSIISLQHVPKGEAVSYGHHWRAAKDSLIGVVAAGYGDGYPKHAPSGTPVMVDGFEVPLVGSVCMDMFMVDLSDHPEVDVGAHVLLWGDGLPVEEVARSAGTLSYELLCNLSKRVSFQW